MRNVFFLISISLSLAVMNFARAGEPELPGVAQGIIAGQIEAFQRDDAAGAYSYAAPGIKKVFSSPEQFMRMVKSGYSPVYRHQSMEFIQAREREGEIVQTAKFVDLNGDVWEALYTLQQADGEWKITGCVLARSSDRAS